MAADRRVVLGPLERAHLARLAQWLAAPHVARWWDHETDAAAVERDFAPWIFTLARHASIDHFRRKPPVAEEAVPETVDYDDPGELLARREDGLELWQRARRRLPEIQFQALWLHYAEDMSVAQVAQVLRKTRIHVKVLLYRARQSLGAELSGAREQRKLKTNSRPRPRAEAVLPTA